MWVSLWVSAMGAWLSARSWATSSITNSGTFIVGGPEYKDTRPNQATYNNLISKHSIVTVTLIAEDAGSPFAVLECGRKCLSIPGCSSIVIRPQDRVCFLSSLDRCSNPTILRKIVGDNFYEVSSGGGVDVGKTCFNICMAKNNGACSVCGRPHCTGSLCFDNCARRCWQANTGKRMEHTLWNEDLTTYHIPCDQDWQLLWPVAELNNRWETDEEVQLRVEVTFEDGTVLHYYYEYVLWVKDKLSVGPPISANYSNWWDAPFADRELDSSSFCKPFFYPPGDCVANGAMSLESQEFFAWKTGIQTLDNTRVTTIELWATKK